MDSPAAIRWYFQSNLKQRTRQGERKQQDTMRKLQKGSISSLIFCNKSGKGRGNNVDTKGETKGVETAHFHQYLNQFLTDCLETFTKQG